MGADSYTKVETMNKEWLDGHAHYQLLQTRLKCGHETLATNRWPASTNMDAYLVMLDTLAEFERYGKRGLQIHGGFSVKLGDNPFAALQAQAAPASSQRRGALPAAPRPRNTATNRQLEAAPAEREELQVGGNWSSKIHDLWTCTSGACGNEKKLCYWTVRNEAMYHVPIIKPVLLAWSEAIRNRTLEPEEPSVEKFGHMVTAKPLIEASPRRRARNALQQGPAKGQTIIYASNAPMPAPVVATPAQSALHSSPVRMPYSSPELSAIEKVEAFIFWCKTERCWRGEEEGLGHVRLQVKEHGESVEGLGNATAEEWQSLGIKSGYRKRLESSVKKWLAAGMPVPGVV
jgi:hypothetical protein